jgi:hypothetical protein
MSEVVDVEKRTRFDLPAPPRAAGMEHLWSRADANGDDCRPWRAEEKGKPPFVVPAKAWVARGAA